MLRNLTDYAIVPFLTSGMSRNFTDCATILPFDFRHVTELHGLPNDGCQVPQSGQTRVASQQTDGPQTKLGYDNVIKETGYSEFASFP